MDAIAEPGLIQAQNEVAEAQTLLTKSNTNINDFVAQYGNPSPQVAYNNEQSTWLSALEAQLQTAKINNDTTRQADSRERWLISIRRTEDHRHSGRCSSWPSTRRSPAPQSAASASNDHAQSADLVAAEVARGNRPRRRAP